MMVGSQCYVPLSSLDYDDETFRSSMERTVETLQESIRSVGLLCPIWVQPKDNGFRIVSGFLRTEAMRSEGVSELPVICREDGSAERLLLETLHENRFTRGFSWAERACILGRTIHDWNRPRSWTIQNVMPALSLNPASRILDDHLQVNTISPSVKKVLVRNGCSLANALQISRWAIADQEALIPVIERLHLGENLLRECLEGIRESALRSGISPSTLLASAECKAILEDHERARPQRTRDFRAHLRMQRHPTLFFMEEAFRRARKNLGTPPKLSINPSPFFEEAGVSVSFRARTPEEFRDLSHRLWKAAQVEGSLETLFRVTEETPT